ncbi:hypothetical protein [Salinigranum salinum]|uniref:hypothetical protein n=1 Tax=Salinigranum salinum TaxID=1364937 RepID=UPI001261124C|nr:hypothetical protein [Salinigranum salinum]
MSVHARTLVVSGARRVVSPAGVALFATSALGLAAFNAALNTVLTAAAGTPLPAGGQIAEYGVVLPVSPAVATLLAGVTLLVGAFAVVVGSRRLLGRSQSRWTDPVECLTHRVVPATIAVLVGSVVVVAAVAFGTVLLVIPGVVVAGHLLLVPSVLAAEDVGLLTALQTSWQRAAAARVELVTAALALVAPATLVVAGASLSYLLPTGVEFVLGVVSGAALLVLWLGVATEAYQRLGTGSKRTTAGSRSRRASRAL